MGQNCEGGKWGKINILLSFPLLNKIIRKTKTKHTKFVAFICFEGNKYANGGSAAPKGRANSHSKVLSVNGRHKLNI